jgi:hypothetical protein
MYERCHIQTHLAWIFFKMMSFNIIFPLTGIYYRVSLCTNLANVVLLKIDYVLQKLVVFWLNPLLTWPVSWMRVSIQSSAYSPREWQPRVLARELKLVNAFFAFVRIKKRSFDARISLASFVNALKIFIALLMAQ